jgi:serine/threonine-protein kinase
MEFIEGEALDRVIRQAARLDQVRAMTIALGICQSLEEAHGLGVLHRDLKPANVMLVNLGSSELVKVIDFGIARLADTAEGDFHTRTGELPGTPAYASYEQLVGQVKMIDQRTDLYALGAILYEMLTGMPPHGDTIKSTKYDSKTLYYIALAKAKAEVTPTPPSRLTRGQPVNPLLEKLILSMLNPVPAQRPTSAGEVRKLLERTLRIVQGLDSPDNATTEAEGGTTLESGVVNTAPGTPYAPDAQRDQAAGDAIEAEFPALSDRPKSTVLVESPANTGLKWAVVGSGAFLVLVLAFLAMLWMTGLAGKTGAQQEGAAQTQPAAVAAPAGPAAAAVAPAPAPPVEAPPGTQEAPVPASQPAVKAEVEPK